MRSLPCPVIQKHTFKHTFIGRKENTPQENTQAHTPAGTHTPGFNCILGKKEKEINFRKKKSNHIKRKIDVPLEQGMDSNDDSDR
jgi:hypothetical protein